MIVSIGIYKNSLLYWALGLSLGVLLSLPTRADLDLAQTPLFLTPSVDPNIMFIIDDSGSMQWETMPDELTNLFNVACCNDYMMWVYPRVDGLHGDGDYGGSTGARRVPTFNSTSIMARAFRSSFVNTTYYNPAITYRPWVNADGSEMAAVDDPSIAPNRPLFPEFGTRNLEADNTETARWVNERVYSNTVDPEPLTFYPSVYSTYIGPVITDLIAAYSDTGGALWDINNYTWTEIKPENAPFTGEGRENRTDCNAAPSCTYNEEIRNFANWYTYHRNRIFTSRAGIGRAFAGLSSNTRVGYGTINHNRTSTSNLDNVAGRAVVRGVRPFTGTQKTDFFNDLYTRPIPTQGTPLRRALDGVGQYFSRNDTRGPWSSTPGVATSGESSSDHLECRHSYAILMTDGYATGTSGWDAAHSNRRANTDGSTAQNTTNVHPDDSSLNFTYSPADPYQDGRDNTLADVAMYYWKRDLRTDLANRVPTSPQNEAFWQHMVTFGIGLGVQGSIDPEVAWQAVVNGDAVSWPDPNYGHLNCGSGPAGTCPARIDDLLHAAINSRGGFFSATDPDTFATELSNTLNSIVARTEGSSASVATNSTRLDTNTVVYQAKFDSRDWTGQFLAYAINADGSLAATPAWDAGQNVTVQGSIGRSIFGYNPTATPFKGINFFHNNLNAAQQALLTEAQLNYVRGIQTNELQNGGTFRNRTGTNRLMGDLVNSDPWFIGDINFGYHLLPGTEGSDYSNYRNSTAYKARTPLVAIGGNGGMLHVFNANITGTGAGTEVFAYVPHAILPKLASLTDPNYSHQYFVDGSPVAGDAYIDANGDNNKEWRTVLIGTLGAGGKGIFALDATFLDPGDSSYATAENSFLPQRVMWEINTTTAPNATDLTNVLTGSNPRFGFADYLGFTLGQASIVRMANGKFAAVFGNGYNSASHQAVLYIVDLETGALIKSLNTGVGTAGNPNGLSTPIAIDANGDRIVDAIYAGDLHGNLWKFDVSNSNTGQWDFGFKQGNTPKPLFVARDNNGVRQPITAKPQAGKHPSSGVMVYFGSGKYFETGDNSVIDPQPQTFYGIQDDCVKLAGSNINCSTGDPGITRANDLVQQSIIAEDVFGDFDIRVTSHCVDPLLAIDNVNCNGISMINYLGSKQGWYMDLVFPAGSPDGERVISQALLRGGRIIFVTLIPDPEPCGYGGTSWLMELDAITGNRLVSTPFDLTGSGTIDESDMLVGVIDTNDDNLIDEDDSPMAVSGKKSKVGIIKTPGVVGAGEVEYKYTSGSTGQMETTLESVEGGAGRQSWRQLR